MIYVSRTHYLRGSTEAPLTTLLPPASCCATLYKFNAVAVLGGSDGVPSSVTRGTPHVAHLAHCRPLPPGPHLVSRVIITSHVSKVSDIVSGREENASPCDCTS